MHTDILLIDGSSFVFRAFHAIPKLNAPDGHPTNATYGVINMLKQMQKKYPTNHWVCVFDAPGKTFRDEIHPEYKANRSETPKELITQLSDIYTLVEALGIPMIIKSGVEADDVIATVALNAESQGKKVTIATGDKDFAQIVNENITLVNTMTNEILDIDGVYNKFGVYPEQIIDYLSLVGDKVDNVPGVEKCGPKTAVKWLTEYKTVEGVIANKDKITGVVGENLRKSIDWLKVARQLITFETKLDIEGIDLANVDSFICNEPNHSKLIDLYTRFNFRTWLKELQQNTNNHSDLLSDAVEVVNTAKKALPTKEFITINSILEFNEITNKIAQNPISICCVADNYIKPNYIKYFAFSSQDKVYLVHNAITSHELFADNEKITDYTDSITKFLCQTNPKYFANLKETLQLLKKLNITITNIAGDLTLVHYIRNSKNKHTMSSIFTEYVSISVEDVPGFNTKLSKDSIYNNENNETKLNQLGIIAQYTKELTEQVYTELSELEQKLYQATELPLAQILVDIEAAGIMLNKSLFSDLNLELSQKIKQLEDKIYQASNVVFNVNSPKQLQDVLFNQLKLSTTGVKKTISGYSTDEDTLQLLSKDGILIANYLLEYRMLSKLLNTYVNKLPEVMDENDRVHTTFDQALVASGRLSSRDPNLQNIPVKNDYGKLIRRGFISKPNHVLMCADYSQIELRILAILSQDENLINAFNTNQDIHSITASEIFHKAITDITSDERRYAKTINFSLIYGKTVFGLAQDLNIDRPTAKLYIDTYFAKYPKVMSCLDNIKAEARNNGYVQTIFGRRVYLPNINNSNRIIRDQEERLALNAPMQGTSADIIKIAMVNIAKWLKDQQLKTKLVLQVHDELIFEVPDDETLIVQENIKSLMENAVSLAVKMQVEINVANNWNDAH